MFIAPLGNGLGELLVEVGLFVGRHGNTSRARASRRLIQSRCKVSLLRLKPLAVEQAERGMFGRRRDGQVFDVERLNQPILPACYGHPRRQRRPL